MWLEAGKGGKRGPAGLTRHPGLVITDAGNLARLGLETQVILYGY